MGIRTVICQGCALIFTNPRPDRATIEKFYSCHYRKFYESSEYPDHEYIESGEFEFRAEVVYSHLKPFLSELEKAKKPIRVLDVGCSEGSILRKLNRTYPKLLDSHGIEPSPAFSDFARSYSGANIFTGSLEAFLSQPDRPNSFDLIILNHVLEHFEKPSEQLNMLHDCLADDGLIFIEVPNILGNWAGKAMIHIAHLYQFSEHTLKIILSKCGFRPVMISTKGNHLHPWAMACVATKTKPENNPKFDPETAALHEQLVKEKFTTNAGNPKPSFLGRFWNRLRHVGPG